MIFNLFRRKANEQLLDSLHDAVMSQARQPVLYSEYGVPDTVEGRYEMVALHGALAVRRLAGLPDPGPEIAQELTDTIFRHFDVALREMGVGDTTVPKRMKKLASGYLGRSKSYLSALAPDAPEPLAAALARNVFGAGEPGAPAAGGDATRLAAYVETLAALLDQTDLETFLQGEIPAVDATTIALANTENT